MATMVRWCLVHAKTGREHEAERHLVRQNYTVFLPKHWRQIRHARRTHVAKRAFFPGYLFVALDLKCDAWRPINSTIGVLRLVTHDHRPATAPDGWVEALQAAVNAEGIVAPKPELEAGARVRVASGPFMDQIGVVERLSGSERVRILLEIMGVATPVDVASERLTRVDALPTQRCGAAASPGSKTTFTVDTGQISN